MCVCVCVCVCVFEVMHMILDKESSYMQKLGAPDPASVCVYRRFIHVHEPNGIHILHCWIYFPLSLPLSLLPAIMQHRRTVSDTLLFRRPSVLEELKKDGPSSSHSSRSTTPLLTLLQPTGEGGMVGQTIVGQGAGSKVAGVVTPQHSPQQQKISPREV